MMAWNERQGGTAAGQLQVYRISAPPNAFCITLACTGLASSCTISSGRINTSTTFPSWHSGSPARIDAVCSQPAFPVQFPSAVGRAFFRKGKPFSDEIGNESIGRFVVEIVGYIPLLDFAMVHDAMACVFVLIGLLQQRNVDRDNRYNSI
ncbi:hypothetical protein SAMN05216417_10188 [Nitrosospira multiformis]|uniref:Uncharacterized protein n=1 Tax=Nitrosospira multiformis TaxID=1231 RepID=A0A1I7F383_9PROT|nr:hypothetical protein SAMN05216417_10188 [Nitrosospira multiformis]